MTILPSDKRAVVIDDERVIADMLTAVLKLNGYQAATAYGGREGIVQALEFQPRLVISDIMMPDVNGIEAAEAIRNSIPDCKFLFVTGGIGAEELLRHSEVSRDSKLLMKPVALPILLATANDLLA